MKTDNKFYQIFVTAPEMLFKMLRIDPHCSYTMKSQTFKELEQQADGVMEPSDPEEPVFVVEFQAQRNERIYQRLVIEMASYGKTYPAKEVLGILIFTKGTLDTKTPPWHYLTKGRNKGIFVFYLDRVLRRLQKDDSTNPLLLLFKPYLVEDLSKLKKSAKGWYSQLENATLPEKTKEVFCDVFFRWFAERFKDVPYKEVYSMLASLTPFEETRAYRDLMEQKIEGKVIMLQELYQQGILSKEIFESQRKPLREQLKKLKKQENRSTL